MKTILIIVFLFFSSVFFSQNFISNKVDSLLSDKFFESVSFSVNIYDLTTQTELYQRNKKLLLTPASNMKILTSAAGLLFLGPEYNFQTSIYYTGEIDDDEIEGDLYFIGGCDPEFNMDNLRKMIRQIKSLGVDEIDGNIYGDVSMMDSLYWGKGWMWDDDPGSYVPYLNPLTINNASIKIAYKPGKIGEPAEITLLHDPGYIPVINNSITVEDDTSDFSVTRNWIEKKDEIIATGKLSITASTDSVEVNLTRPAEYFMHLVCQLFEEEGIDFGGEINYAATPREAVMLSKNERPYKEIITALNKNSNNLNAEMTLRALASKHFCKPASAENGLKMIDSLVTLIGLNPEYYSFADGSGISSYNLISTELLLEILKNFYFHHPELYKILFESFPVAGIDGTLANRMKDCACIGNVHAKTGTKSVASSLSGYLNSKNDHNIVFSIIFENFLEEVNTARKIQDEICKILCEAEI
ncbi:MAG: D-alanyl-D-alanine carboxypeptidase/D-alanyl-D-alanine-endopeptidase [bacterium]